MNQWKSLVKFRHKKKPLLLGYIRHISYVTNRQEFTIPTCWVELRCLFCSSSIPSSSNCSFSHYAALLCIVFSCTFVSKNEWEEPNADSFKWCMKHGKCTLTTGKMTKDAGMVFKLQNICPGRVGSSISSLSTHLALTCISMRDFPSHFALNIPSFFSLHFSPFWSLSRIQV